jgi:hypothetical protein
MYIKWQYKWFGNNFFFSIAHRKFLDKLRISHITEFNKPFCNTEKYFYLGLQVKVNGFTWLYSILCQEASVSLTKFNQNLEMFQVLKVTED